MTALAMGWFVHLVSAAWQATAAAAIALFILRVTRTASPRFRHAVALIGIAKFAIPPMLPLPTGLFSYAPAVDRTPVLGETMALIRSAHLAPILIVAMMVHFAGVLVALTRIAIEAAQLSRLRRASSGGQAPSPVLNCTILISNEATVPISLGVFRRTILLPASFVASLSPAELRDVIAHEAMHHRRGDVLLNWIASLLRAFWWFHPLLGALDRASRHLREECCDDDVVAERGGTAGYARTLLTAASLFTDRAPRLAAGIAETPHALLRRVGRMATPGFAPVPRLGLVPRLAALAIALFLLPGLRVSVDNHIAFDHATIHALIHR
jgi:beta-lactamase regulating signal transducer with metallopeptidase domain